MVKTPHGLINHVILVLDASSSMWNHADDVIKVADAHVGTLADKSKEYDQETRVSVYTFNTYDVYGGRARIEVPVYDKDVLRMPSVSGYYKADGRTPLCDAMVTVIDDLKMIPQKYGDHAFLVYLLTDGQENQSQPANVTRLQHEIPRLPGNWTLAAYVPDVYGAQKLQGYGFPKGNIQVWNPSRRGAVREDVGTTMTASADTYYSTRSSGLRSTQDLFTMAAPAVKDVKKNLVPLTPGSYRFEDVTEEDLRKVSGGRIDEFMQLRTGKPYSPGKAYYEMTKRERIQHYKTLAVVTVNPRTGMTEDAYVGENARQLLGLPTDGSDVRVSPGKWKGYRVFILSTSFNRRLQPNTQLLVIR